MRSNRDFMSFSIKAVAVSSAVVSAAVMLHLSAPTIVRLASSEIPKIYGSFVSWLTPPYIYFIINGIIISIAACSRFHKSGSEDVIGSEYESEPVGKQEFVVVAAPTSEVEEVVKVDYFAPMAEYVTAVQEKRSDEREEEVVTPTAEYVTAVQEKRSYEREEEVVKVDYFAPMAEYVTAVQEKPSYEREEEVVMSKSNWTTPVCKETEVKKGMEYSFLTDKATEIPTKYPVLTEKPPVSSRLGRRKSLKSSPEAGKALGVARPKRNDTLESTWKAITDGRAVPLTRHLKKSDTWETHHHARSSPDPDPDPTLMCKSETFTDGGGGPRRPATSVLPPSRLRKEPSVGQDDLNRRVEAFIKKINAEMKLQRQDSFQQYTDMMNRGSH